MKKEKANKKTNYKILIPIIIIIIILVVVLIPKNNTNSTNTTKNKTDNQELNQNTGEKIIEDKTINNIKFTNIKCIYDGNNSILTYTITNIGSEKVNLNEYEIVVKDKDGNILTNLLSNLDYDLEPNQPYETGNSVNIDISTADSIEINLE